MGAVAVANLPVNGRNFIDFALTTPGVTRDTQRRHQLRGLRGVLNSLVIDGADNNTFFGRPGRTGPAAPPSVQPGRGGGVPGQRNAYSAEYGRAGGR